MEIERRINMKALFVIASLAFLNACSNGGIEVTTYLSNTNDIETGALVYFEDQVVGEVSDIVTEAAGVRIALNIDKVAAAKISQQSAVVVNRLKDGAPLEMYNPSVVGEEFLQAGQEVKGLDSMFQLGAWLVGDAIQVGSGSITQYVNAFQDYLKGQQFQEDKAAVRAQIEEAKDAASEAISSMELELDNAAKEMATSEKEMAAAVEEFGEELAPVVQELSKNGAELMQELEKFAQGLEQTSPDEQMSGQKFMKSLLSTLQQLNQSIEQGLEQAQKNEAPQSN